jgi:NAD(P)H-nitrite reductase large subunit
MKHLILGNGPAGVLAAEVIRKHAPGDEIVLVGAEAEPPYSRMAIPYLLSGKIEEAGTYLRKDPGHFDRLRVRLKRGRATGVSLSSRTVSLHDGSSLPFDRLLLATGSVPLAPPVPGIDLPGVHACWPGLVRASCRWAPGSSAASSWRRWRPAACSSRSWRWATAWCLG